LIENQHKEKIAELVRIDLALLEKSSLLEVKIAQLKEIESRVQDIVKGGTPPPGSLPATNARSDDRQSASDHRRAMSRALLQQLRREQMFGGPVEFNDLILIRPRFECLVEKVYVKAGQAVKKGDPLVDVFSVELVSAKNDFLTKGVKSKHDQTILDARRKLFATNAISEQVLTDAQNNEEKSKLEVQVAREKLKFLGLSDEAIGLVGKEEGDQKARLTLRAPVDGAISKIDAEAGILYDMKSVLLIFNATLPGQATQP
jgi:membrane fusion protein, heavy metal efflux system